MDLTRENWPRRLLTANEALRLPAAIREFNHWWRDEIARRRFPFFLITWWSDGRCCVHNSYGCSQCTSVLGGPHSQNTSAARAPDMRDISSSRPWRYFQEHWVAGTLSDQDRRRQHRPEQHRPRQHEERRSGTFPSSCVSVPAFSHRTMPMVLRCATATCTFFHIDPRASESSTK